MQTGYRIYALGRQSLDPVVARRAFAVVFHIGVISGSMTWSDCLGGCWICIRCRPERKISNTCSAIRLQSLPVTSSIGSYAQCLTVAIPTWFFLRASTTSLCVFLCSLWFRRSIVDVCRQHCQKLYAQQIWVTGSPCWHRFFVATHYLLPSSLQSYIPKSWHEWISLQQLLSLSPSHAWTSSWTVLQIFKQSLIVRHVPWRRFATSMLVNSLVISTVHVNTNTDPRVNFVQIKSRIIIIKASTTWGP